MARLLILIAIVAFSAPTLLAQKKICKVGSIEFQCPSKYYPEIKVNDPTVRIFEYKDGDGKVYFFMADPARKITSSVLSELIPGLKGPFKWKAESDPLIMDLGTKYKFDLVAELGLSDQQLVEVKTFIFDVKGMKVVLGYLADWSEGPKYNRALFDAGKGFGDNASACNQVVTALNSITHEFRASDAGCTLSISLGTTQ